MQAVMTLGTSLCECIQRISTNNVCFVTATKDSAGGGTTATQETAGMLAYEIAVMGADAEETLNAKVLRMQLKMNLGDAVCLTVLEMYLVERVLVGEDEGEGARRLSSKVLRRGEAFCLRGAGEGD